MGFRIVAMSPDCLICCPPPAPGWSLTSFQQHYAPLSRWDNCNTYVDISRAQERDKEATEPLTGRNLLKVKKEIGSSRYTAFEENTDGGKKWRWVQNPMILLLFTSAKKKTKNKKPWFWISFCLSAGLQKKTTGLIFIYKNYLSLLLSLWDNKNKNRFILKSSR